VQGDKPVIYPVLEWLLRHMTELKERAYLARYLVKIDIPQDFMVDSQIAELYEQVCTYELMSNTVCWSSAGQRLSIHAYVTDTLNNILCQKHLVTLTFAKT